jgi:WD40 repeat protein
MSSLMDNIKLILSETNNKIAITMDKNYLENLSPYFKNLLTFGKEKNQSEIVIEVDNILIAKDVITGVYSLIEYCYILKTLQLQNYFEMNIDINKLYDLIVPPGGFDMLLETIDELNCPFDDKLIATIKKNMPDNYGLNNLSNEFIEELISKKYYLVSNCQHNIVVWHIVNDKPMKTLDLPTENTYDLTISPDNQVIISVCQGIVFNSIIAQYNISTGNMFDICCVNGINQEDKIFFSPNGQIFACVTMCSSRIIDLWDVSTGKLLNSLDKHTNIVKCVAFSPNSQMIASGSSDKNIILWDVCTGKILQTLIGHINIVRSVVFSPDNSKIVSGCEDFIKIWSVSSGKCLYTLIGYDNDGMNIVFSPNGQTVASTGLNNKINLWNISTGVLLHTFIGFNQIQCIAFSPDGKFIASAYSDYSIELWNTSSGELFNTLVDCTHNVRGIVFSGFVYDDVDKKLIEHLTNKK